MVKKGWPSQQIGLVDGVEFLIPRYAVLGRILMYLDKLCSGKCKRPPPPVLKQVNFILQTAAFDTSTQTNATMSLRTLIVAGLCLNGYVNAQIDPQLTGTWSTKSAKVFTGPVRTATSLARSL